MTVHASSVFDRCVAQALEEAAPLMASLCDAALRQPAADPWLRDKRGALPASFASRLKLAVRFAAQDLQDAYQALLDDCGESNWGPAAMRLYQRTADSLADLESIYRPLRKQTADWRHGNPLRPEVYLDTLHSTLLDQGIAAGEPPAFLDAMVEVLGEYLARSYAAIAEQARAECGQQLQQAEHKRAEAHSPARQFARRVRPFFAIPRHCPVGAIRAYKELLPVLERVAASEPAFFDDPQHAARCLVQAIVDQAVALKNAGAVEAFPQFSVQVNATLAFLSDLTHPTADDFARELPRYSAEAAEQSQPQDAPVSEWGGSGWSASLHAEAGGDSGHGFLASMQSIQPAEPAPVVVEATVAEPESEYLPKPLPADWSLEPGAMLEFLSQGQWLSRQLSWVSPQRTMFLFTATDGTSQTITRRMLDKLAREQAVRLR
ncbi:hypothetical protein [Comamonas humi]